MTAALLTYGGAGGGGAVLAGARERLSRALRELAEL
jgi:hypothetical protein